MTWLWPRFYGRGMAGKIRVGIGYDVHSFTQKRQLVLGGVDIPFDKGLDGWSDADVLTHAVIDALLGAAGLGDIGGHFPAGEAQYRDISSLTLLEKVRSELAENGWQVANIDATVVTEQPRINDYADQMRQQLSQTLGVHFNQVSIKASTSERMGFIGRGEGMACWAVTLIEQG